MRCKRGTNSRPKIFIEMQFEETIMEWYLRFVTTILSGVHNILRWHCRQCDTRAQWKRIKKEIKEGKYNE